MKEYSIGLVKPFAERINAWDNSGTHVQLLLKTNLIDFLCRMQDEAYLRKASDYFNSLNPFYFIFPFQINNTYDYFYRISKVPLDIKCTFCNFDANDFEMFTVYS